MGKRPSAPLSTRLPSKTRVDTFITLLRAGNSVKTAAPIAGISERSVYFWAAEAESDDCRPWVRQFVQRTREARALAQAANLQVITKAARDGTWQAAAWYLERTMPNEYGRFERREVAVDAQVTLVRPEEVRSRLASIIETVGAELDDQEPVGADSGPTVVTSGRRPLGAVGSGGSRGARRRLVVRLPPRAAGTAGRLGGVADSLRSRLGQNQNGS